MPIIFAYVQGMKGPEPQLWRGAPTNGAGVSKPALQSIELSDIYDRLTLGELVTLFPYKGAA